MIDNQIKIPWYRRNIKIGNQEDSPIQPTHFNIPNLPKPKPSGEPKPQLEPEPEPVREPSRVPSKVPVLNPEPFPFPDKFPLPFPLPPFKESPFGKPSFPFPFPIPKPNGNKGLPKANPTPQPTFIEPAPKQTAFDKIAGTILKPVIYFFAAKQVSNQIIQAKITDPVYNRMVKDPVLGFALREAEKSNLDMETAVNYFANYDYSNFNAEQMTKELTTLFGAAAAARLIVYFIGRKVVFKF